MKPLTIFTVTMLAACGSGAAVAQERTQHTFDSPEAAVQALIAATSKNDSAELAAVLGSKGQGLLTSGDAGQDQAERREFAQLASARHKIEPSSMKAGTMILVVGDQEWPFPVPLIREDQRWRFDAGMGSLEVRARRVGANELDAIEICAGYVEAQQAYATEHRSGAATMEYARVIMSSPGQKNGLTRNSYLRVSPMPRWKPRGTRRSHTTATISAFSRNKDQTRPEDRTNMWPGDT